MILRRVRRPLTAAAHVLLSLRPGGATALTGPNVPTAGIEGQYQILEWVEPLQRSSAKNAVFYGRPREPEVEAVFRDEFVSPILLCHLDGEPGSLKKAAEVIASAPVFSKNRAKNGYNIPSTTLLGWLHKNCVSNVFRSYITTRKNREGQKDPEGEFGGHLSAEMCTKLYAVLRAFYDGLMRGPNSYTSELVNKGGAGAFKSLLEEMSLNCAKTSIISGPASDPGNEGPYVQNWGCVVAPFVRMLKECWWVRVPDSAMPVSKQAEKLVCKPSSKEPSSKEPSSKEPSSKEPSSKEPSSKEPPPVAGSSSLSTVAVKTLQNKPDSMQQVHVASSGTSGQARFDTSASSGSSNQKRGLSNPDLLGGIKASADKLFSNKPLSGLVESLANNASNKFGSRTLRGSNTSQRRKKRTRSKGRRIVPLSGRNSFGRKLGRLSRPLVGLDKNGSRQSSKDSSEAPGDISGPLTTNASSNQSDSKTSERSQNGGALALPQTSVGEVKARLQGLITECKARQRRGRDTVRPSGKNSFDSNTSVGSNKSQKSGKNSFDSNTSVGLNKSQKSSSLKTSTSSTVSNGELGASDDQLDKNGSRKSSKDSSETPGASSNPAKLNGLQNWFFSKGETELPRSNSQKSGKNSFDSNTSVGSNKSQKSSSLKTSTSSTVSNGALRGLDPLVGLGNLANKASDDQLDKNGSRQSSKDSSEASGDISGSLTTDASNNQLDSTSMHSQNGGALVPRKNVLELDGSEKKLTLSPPLQRLIANDMKRASLLKTDKKAAPLPNGTLNGSLLRTPNGSTSSMTTSTYAPPMSSTGGSIPKAPSTVIRGPLSQVYKAVQALEPHLKEVCQAIREGYNVPEFFSEFIGQIAGALSKDHDAVCFNCHRPLPQS